MGTLISTIISDAYRESNLTGLGQTPTDAEMAEGLVLLNRFIDSLWGAEMGENLINIPFGLKNVITTDIIPLYYNDLLNSYLPVNTRLLCNLEGPETVTLAPQPFDGSRMQFVDVSGNFQTFPLTVQGNGRNILGNPTIVLSDNNYNTFFFYRADLANWMKVNDLALTDVSPFPEEFDDFLIIGLADRINVRNGITMSPESVGRFKRCKGQFYARYAQTPEVPSEQGLIRIPSNKVYRNYDAYTFGSFERGIPWW
jgi:hypothetical protein